MKDIGQFKPIETGTVSEVAPTDPPKGKQDGTPSPGDTAVSNLSKHDSLSKTDAQHAKLEHTVTFDDGKATTTPSTTGSETTVTPDAPTQPVDSTTTNHVSPPLALTSLDQATMAIVIEALSHCKEQNFKAALDVLDKAIASHRKMMEAQAARAKKEAPIVAAKKQAQALETLRQMFIAEEAAAKAADNRKAAV